MEIPITDVVETLGKLALIEPVSGKVTLATIQAKLDAIDVIIAQAKEIQELQLVIVRLRDELLAMAPGHGTDFWAKRRMATFKAMPEPRVSWEDFKRTWKDH